ncbi:hypothetical protein C0995_002059 [Termitomyces sp. Mi166|nr:hypothetical protein C0995_002059 [Termitomyces sp. Mi166\
MQDAQDSLCNALHIIEKGVQSFYDTLLNHAHNMAMYLDEFTIWKHFLKGMLSDMLMVLICDGGLTLDVNTVEEFVAKAKAYKSSIKTAAHYLEHSLRQHLGKVVFLAAAYSSKLGTMLNKHPDKPLLSGHVPIKQPAKVIRPVGLHLKAKPLTPKMELVVASLDQSNWTGGRPGGVTLAGPGKHTSTDANCYKCDKRGHFARECMEPTKPAPQEYIHMAYTAMLTNVDKADNEQKNVSAEEEADNAFQNGKKNNIKEEYINLEMYENKYYTHDSDSKALFALADELRDTVCVVDLQCTWALLHPLCFGTKDFF